MSRSARLLAVLIITLHPILIAAQTTDVSCVASSSTAFLFNADGESPCLVWAKLQSLCLPSTSTVNIPSLLGAGYGYILPNGDSTACQCNSVAYNLMAGCTYCQFRDASSIVSESTFSSGCRAYDSSGFGFDETVLPIPAYAWRTWNGQSWTPAQAAVAASSYAAVSYPSEGHPTTLSRSFTTADKSDSSTPAMIITSSTPTLSSSSSSNDESSTSDGNRMTPTPSSSLNLGSASASASSASTGPSIPTSHRSAIIAGSVLGAAAFLIVIILFLVRRYRVRNKAASFSPAGRLSPSHPRPMDPRAAQEAFGRQYGHDPRSILSFSDIPPGGAPRPARDAHFRGEEEIWTEKDRDGAATGRAFEHPRTAPIAEDQYRDSRWRYTGETGYTGYTPYTGRSGYTQRTGREVDDEWTDDEGEYEDEYNDHYHHDQQPGAAPGRLAPVQPAPAGQIGRSPVLPNPHRESTPPQRQAAESQNRAHEYSPQDILTGKQRTLNQLSPPPSRPSHPSSVAADTNYPSPGHSTYPESVDFSVQIPTPAISRPSSKYRPSTRYTQGPFLDPFRIPPAGRSKRLASDVATLPSLYDPGTAAQYKSQPRYSEESRYPPTAQTDTERQKWAATPLPPIPPSQRR